MGPTILARLHHHFHSRMLSHYYSAWRLWAAVFRPWPGSPLLRQPGGLGLPHNHHIDTELNADILSTWRTMEENPQPQVIHHTQFSSSWVTEMSHHLQLLGDWAYFQLYLAVMGLVKKKKNFEVNYVLFQEKDTPQSVLWAHFEWAIRNSIFLIVPLHGNL